MNYKKAEKLSESLNESLFHFATKNPDSYKYPEKKSYSYWMSTFYVFHKNKTALFFLSIITLLIIFTFIQPYLPNQKLTNKIYTDPSTNLQLINQTPSREFIFGTNAIGQDLWSRIWSGTRTSLLIGLLVGIWDAIIGIIIGSIWGYIRKLDRVLTEIYNILNNIPNTIILVLLTYILKPSIGTLIFAMCITGWLGMARFIRNQIIIIRDREYNLASKALGTPIIRIIFKNILPYLVSVIMLRISLTIPAAIGSEVFLTYIGLGLPLDKPSLGNLINEGRGVIMYRALRYQLLFPAFILSLISVSFFIIGNAFADAADPKNHFMEVN